METVKAAEDGRGIIFRLYESENSLTKTRLTVNRAFTKAYICNLLEEEVSEVQVDGNTVNFVCKPYEIVTVKVV